MLINTSTVVSRLVTINEQAAITAVVISAKNLLRRSFREIQGLLDSDAPLVTTLVVTQPPSVKSGQLNSVSWSMLHGPLGFPRS